MAITPVRNVPKVSSELRWRDAWGTFKARWGVGRMNYTVDPGLYAIGDANEQSPVLVTSNYKMTFDVLRSSLDGLAAWILVMDTKGINVWCSAGKGTFSTEEVVNRIEQSDLSRVVSHRRVILPQLAGPGVAAHEVKKLSGFRAVFGPIRSRDIRQYLESGYKATADMRRKTFDWWERLVLIPVELVDALKAAALILPAFFLLAGVLAPGAFWANASTYGLFAVLSLAGAILAGAVLTPLFLPWLPGRAFSTKGLLPAALTAGLLLIGRAYWWGPALDLLEICAWLLMSAGVVTYLSMNFTGASTYTSLSGVKKEMQVAVPLQIGAVVLGAILWIASLLSA